MPTPVQASTVTSLASQTYKDLETLKAKIEESASFVNKEDLVKFILKIQHEANQLTTAIAKSKSPLQPKMKGELKELIDDMKHMSTLTQALGEQQALLLGVFKRLDGCIKDTKFDNKVTKVDNEPLS